MQDLSRTSRYSPRRIPSRRTISAALLLTALAATGAPLAWALPVPTNCQIDPSGPDNRPNQRDMTRFCVDAGDGAPYELHTIVNSDEIRLTGANTIDVCALFNTDGDAFVNAAVCVTLQSSGADNDNLTEFQSLRLFTCRDTKADRCMNPVLLPGPYGTTCEATQSDDDPFSPAVPGGPGDDYPWDSRVLCAIDLDDFGAAAASARLMDGCSYPSSVPNSDAEDCVLFRSCSNATDCDDDNPCSLDTCESGGVCMHVPAPPAPCSDDLYCNGTESCNPLGFCGTSTEARDCDDGIACTIDDCDELADACRHDPRASICDDGLFCNGVESCDAATGCTAGEAPNCSDGVSCTTEACDEDSDSCSHVADDGACDDGQFCNGRERCDARDGCLPGTGPDCDDAVACTTDACNENADACVHGANDAACSNGIFCDGEETCQPGLGCVPGSDPDCDDGVACTADRCDDQWNACLHEPRNSFCDNGVFCDGAETCDPVADCRPGTGSCSGCSTDADCDNGVFCDGVETCDVVSSTCSPGAPPLCDDGVDCTLDACEEFALGCSHTPVDSACDNGLFCDGREACDAVAGCVADEGPACDDGIDCTVDSCNEAGATCVHAPSDARCDNGRYCDGKETCSEGYGCNPGDDVICRPDAVRCSVEKCNEATDSCASDFSGCICGDREITGLEECEPPQRAGTFEDCNNLVDDDRDGLVDCTDLDCLPSSGRKPICDENCRRDLACAPVRDDPALIKFRYGRGHDSLWIHGRFAVDARPDPGAEEFTLRLSNDVEPVFVATLQPGDLDGQGDYYKFLDPDARALGAASARDGLALVRLRYRVVDDQLNLSFRVQAYGDFGAARHRNMTSQVSLGTESGTLTAEWKAKPGRWLLRGKDF